MRVLSLITVLFLSSAATPTRSDAAAPDRAARVTGHVEDSLGGVVPGAGVTLRRPGGSMNRTIETSPEGRFEFDEVPAGTYTVVVVKERFETIIRTNLEVRGEGPLELVFRLAPIALRESVEVVASQTSEVAVVPESLVHDTPSLDQSPLALALLTPGVDSLGPQVASAEGRLSANAAGWMRANGSRPSQGMFLIDGVDLTGVWRNQSNLTPLTYMLREVSVSTVGARAEVAKGPGPSVNYAVRSGTNAFRGELFGYFNSEQLNANSWSRNRVLGNASLPATQRARAARPEDNRKMFGATLGGPVVKGKLFFYAGLQALRDDAAFTYDQDRAPTPAMLNGDFSALPGLTLYDPVTKLPFLRNVIPQDRIDPVSRQLAALLPTATSFGTRYLWTGRDPISSDQALFKLTYTASRRQTLSVTYLGAWGTGYQSDHSGNHNPFWAGYVDRHRQHALGAQHRWDINRSYFLETVVAFQQSSTDRDNTSEYNRRLDQMGSNWPLAGGDVDYPDPDYLPQLTISGGIGGHSGALDPISQRGLRASSALGWRRGSHTVKVGALWAHDLVEVSNRRDQSRFTFDGRFTWSAAANVAASGTNQYAHGIADLLLGRSSSFGISARLKNDVSDTTWGVFVQDDWRATRRLTVSAGLRWDFGSAPSQPDNRLSSFVLGHRSDQYPNLPLHMAVDGDRGVPPGMYSPDRDNIAPRLGVAYLITSDGKTLLRASAGVYYGDPPLAVKRFLNENEPYFRSLTGSSSRSLVNPWASTYPLGPPLPLELSPSAVTYRPTQRVAFNTVDPNRFPTPWSLDAHVGLERRISRGMTASASYVRARGYGNLLLLDSNAPPPTSVGSSSSDTSVDLRRPVGSPYRQIRELSAVDDTRYDGLHLALNVRQGGFTGRIVYALQRAFGASDLMTGGDVMFGATVIGTSKQDVSYFQGEQGAHHVLRGSVLYSVPRPKGKTGRALLGGWTFGTSVSVRSGNHLTVRAGRDLNFDGISSPGSDRPDQTGSMRYPEGDTTARGDVVWFDKSVFAQAPAPSSANPYPLGSTPVGGVVGPGSWTVGFNITKRVDIRRSTRILLRLNVSNVFNHPNLGSPIVDMSSADFGVVTSRSGERRMQLGIRLTF
jgi:hypothetical protein